MLTVGIQWKDGLCDSPAAQVVHLSIALTQAVALPLIFDVFHHTGILFLRWCIDCRPAQIYHI